jgi:hypothetical protein
MATVVGKPAEPTAGTGYDEDRPCYVVNIYTWLTDEATAVDLAIRISEIVGPLQEVDECATTIALDDADPNTEPRPVFVAIPSPVPPGHPLRPHFAALMSRAEVRDDHLMISVDVDPDMPPVLVPIPGPDGRPMFACQGHDDEVTSERQPDSTG